MPDDFIKSMCEVLEVLDVIAFLNSINLSQYDFRHFAIEYVIDTCPYLNLKQKNLAKLILHATHIKQNNC